MIEIIETKDGSHTLLNTELQETYHSTHGAMQESKHVFIRHGMEHALASGKKELSVFEVGFGTGLNAWLTLRHGMTLPVKIKYTTVESFPLVESVWSGLNYADNSDAIEIFKKLHRCEWNNPVSIQPDFEIHKINSTIQEFRVRTDAFDVIYFDAFAPNKQPEMWEPFVLDKIVSSMRSGAIFVTYCAKGQVKRNLKNLGLTVETLPGPPGKREMTRAVKK